MRKAIIWIICKQLSMHSSWAQAWRQHKISSATGKKQQREEGSSTHAETWWNFWHQGRDGVKWTNISYGGIGTKAFIMQLWLRCLVRVSCFQQNKSQPVSDGWNSRLKLRPVTCGDVHALVQLPASQFCLLATPEPIRCLIWCRFQAWRGPGCSLALGLR